jgi:hypothetical protein
MDPFEAFLISLIAAIAQSLAAAITPLLIQQAQQPSTAQDSFTDTALQTRIQNAIKNPASSSAD